ncbi:SWI/SNF-related matrix-associated actin-dependent regulator of chromatin subfamily A-like protein 1 [Diachasma alloeum]|uniref:SWI/SNF-related matrix-associated actin-dependent regulator of chromatin subfamily A-like protein 1 n=1 Tax=Diachasma alloeum TaxID=454923 RepID=UPI0007384E54|nr:SWI/SNF-related matrix-associated actin-dependent regulator of chromatin subfamily A-like protein 1 [Diachasma alloeum]
MYSPAEIEKKRLLAQQKKAQLNQNRVPHPHPVNPVTPKPPPFNSTQSVAKPQSQSKPQPGNQLKLTCDNSPPGVKRKRESNQSTGSKPKHFKNVNTIQPDTFFGTTERIKATCRMVTSTRFEVEVPYHAQLIDFFKTMATRAYDQKTRLWNFHINDYSQLINGIKSQFTGHVDVSGIPQFVLQTFKTELKRKPETTEADLSRIDNTLISKLMPFQRDGILFGIQKNGRCMIADEMGLGKTIQALGIAHYFKASWPLLIVTPSSIRYQWSEAIHDFLPSVPYQHIFHYTSGRDRLEKEKITIVSYDLLSRNITTFEKKSFGFVIFDESHTLKSHKTDRTKAAKKISSAARHVLLLTGTPALSRPIELFSQICLVNPKWIELKDYGIRYCEAKRGHFGWDYSGVCNTTELQLLLKASFLIRRLKSEVLTQLPDKIRQVVMLDPELIKEGTKEMKKMAEKLQENTLKGFEKHAELLRYYSESSKLRLTAVANYVKDLIDKKQKFLIFAHHQCVLDKISEVLDKNKVKYIRIDGKTNADIRKRNVDQFQESSDCLVAVLSITAANSGLTLTAASLVVFAELYWNPAELSQAEARAHRIGQRNYVIIQYLIAKGTVDDILWPLLQTKANFLKNAGLDQNFSLSQAELMHQPNDEPSTTDDKRGTLESFGFSQTISLSQQEEFLTPMEAFSDKPQTNTSRGSSTSVESPQKTAECDNVSVSEDLAKLLEDDDEDFENIDLDNIT